jgi:hypothetical protein
MAHRLYESAFHGSRTRLGFSLGLAGLMLGGLSSMPAPAAASPPQDRARVTATMQGDLATITGTQNSQGTHEPGVDDIPAQSTPSSAKNRALAKANFEKAKADADQLSELAKALQLELSKSNGNILSLDVIDKAAKIEKLAKKIKGTAKGF